MAGSLAGLLCTESGAGEAADRVRRESAHALLASLEENSRFVLADSFVRMKSVGSMEAKDVDVVLRCVPLALWLRGPNDRIALASVRLAELLGADEMTTLGAAFNCQWLRNLFSRGRPRSAWQRTMKDMDAIAAFLDTTPELLAVFRAGAESPSMSLMHPVTRALRSVDDVIQTQATLAGLMASLAHAGTDASTRVLGAAAGGMLFGFQQASQLWPEAISQEPQRTWVEALGRRGDHLYRLDRWPPETSTSHPLPIAELIAPSGGRIGISPAPGRQGFDSPNAPVLRDLVLDVEQIAQWGADHVVCLLQADTLLDAEMAGLGPAIQERKIRFWHIPKSDLGQDPWFEQEWRRVLPILSAALGEGRRILIHGLDLDGPALELAANLLVEATPGLELGEAHQQAKLAVELAKLDFTRHDQDE